MPEPITLELVTDTQRTLGAAFPGRALDERQLMLRADVYRNGLSGLSGEALRWAVKTAIQEDQYFPKVARLRELACRWTEANHATHDLRGDADPLWCHGCRSRCEWQERWRHTLDARSRVRTSPDGEWLYLERYERSLCQCAPPCLYAPDQEAPSDEPAMRITAAPFHTQWCAAESNPRVSDVLSRAVRTLALQKRESA